MTLECGFIIITIGLFIVFTGNSSSSPNALIGYPMFLRPPKTPGDQVTVENWVNPWDYRAYVLF
jgi:hypothetical protein